VYDQSGKPAGGTHVVFLDATGATVSDTTTDPSTGVATATMTAGGSVTAESPLATSNPDESQLLSTFLGVQPGDHLVVGVPQVSSPPATFTVTIPHLDNAASYSVLDNCNTNGTVAALTSGPVSMTVSYDSTCTRPGLAVFANDNTGAVLGSIYKPTQVLTASVDLAGETYLPPTDVSFTVTNLPPSVTNLDVAITDVFDTGDTLFQGQQNLSLATPTTSLRMPQLPGATSIAAVQASRAGALQVVLRAAPQAAAVTLDLASLLLSWVLGTPVYDGDHRAVQWIEAGPGTPDVVGAFLAYNNGAHAVAWQLVAPYQSSKLVLPVLPGSLATFNPAADTTMGIQVFLTKYPPGRWDAVRGNFFSGFGLVPSLVSANPPAVAALSIGGLGIPRVAPSPSALFANRPTHFAPAH
jgi:hypothetical protein